MKRLVPTVIGALAMALILTASAASAASSTWKLASGSVSKTGSGLATFGFVVPDSARLLSLSVSKYGIPLGETTMTASYTVAGVTGNFTYGGEPSCGGTTGNVRLYFESITPGSKFAYTNYWWSDVAWSALANGGPVTLASLVDANSGWSDWNGQSSLSQSAAFQVAAGAVTAYGLSFGGGCFFENGVGTTDGSGSFTLNTFVG
jgi:hypothetical protein